MEFPKNKLKETLKSGKPAIGTFLNVPSPNVVEMIGYAGLDFVIIDSEHGRPDRETMENMVRACEVSGTTAIIRIPNVDDRTHYIHALDSGAMGVQVPMIESGELAEAAVRFSKYHPRGIRGLAGGRATKYGAIPTTEYVKQANEQTMVIAQIETVQGCKAAEEIAAVDGVDVVFIGPSDLSQSMGVPGQQAHPDVRKMIDEVTARIIAAGKPVGCLTNSVEMAADQIKKGMQYLCIPSVVVYGFCKNMADAIRKI
ncbi:MAG: aldolase/citrate lyase family protein [Bacillota bacterium]|nr:aldolase/citrate lyase family protein [Bacillota bacterium]